MFRRCINCHSYFETEGTSTDLFCSRACKLRYSRCKVCGQYFELTKELQEGFCSEDCKKVYSDSEYSTASISR